MTSSHDEPYYLEWNSNSVAAPVTKLNPNPRNAGITVRAAWECKSVNDIPEEYFVSMVKDLLGYVPECKYLNTHECRQTWILFKNQQDAMAFKIKFEGKYFK